MEPLPGYKTYLVAGAMMLYALAGGFLGYVEPQHALEIFMQGVALISVRLGISKAQI